MISTWPVYVSHDTTWRLSDIWKNCLSFETSSTIARSIVLSRLDYCNSVLYGTYKKNLKKLQNIQNSMVRIIYSLPARSTTQPLLKALHWLPIEKRIIYKIGLLTFKCRNNLAPTYTYVNWLWTTCQSGVSDHRIPRHWMFLSKRLKLLAGLSVLPHLGYGTICLSNWDKLCQWPVSSQN